MCDPNRDEDLSNSITLLEYLKTIQRLHNRGGFYRHKSFGTDFAELQLSQIIDVVEAVATRVVEYNKGHNIAPTSYDLPKLVAFTAVELYNYFNDAHNHDPSVDVYDPSALFYGYFFFLDFTLENITLRDAIKFLETAENMAKFIKSGQTLAPFTLLKGVDLGISAAHISRRPPSHDF